MRQIETNELASFPNSWLFFSLLNLDFSDCLKNGTGLPSSGTMKENQTLVFKNESHESFKRGFKKKKKKHLLNTRFDWQQSNNFLKHSSKATDTNTSLEFSSTLSPIFPAVLAPPSCQNLGQPPIIVKRLINLHCYFILKIPNARSFCERFVF